MTHYRSFVQPFIHSFFYLQSFQLFPLTYYLKCFFISSHLISSRLVSSLPHFSSLLSSASLLTFSASTILALNSTTSRLWPTTLEQCYCYCYCKTRLLCRAIKVQSQQKWLQSVVVEAEAEA